MGKSLEDGVRDAVVAWQKQLLTMNPRLHRAHAEHIPFDGPQIAQDYQVGAHTVVEIDGQAYHVKTPRLEGFITMQLVRPWLEKRVFGVSAIRQARMVEAADYEMRQLRALNEGGIKTFVPVETVRKYMGKPGKTSVVTEQDSEYESIFSAVQDGNVEDHVQNMADLLSRMHNYTVFRQQGTDQEPFFMPDPYVGNFGYNAQRVLIPHGFTSIPNEHVHPETLLALVVIGLALNVQGNLGVDTAAALIIDRYAPHKHRRRAIADVAAETLIRGNSWSKQLYATFVHGLSSEQMDKTLEKLANHGFVSLT